VPLQLELEGLIGRHHVYAPHLASGYVTSVDDEHWHVGFAIAVALAVALDPAANDATLADSNERSR
jgi:hypothetical protein